MKIKCVTVKYRLNWKGVSLVVIILLNKAFICKFVVEPSIFSNLNYLPLYLKVLQLRKFKILESKCIYLFLRTANVCYLVAVKFYDVFKNCTYAINYKS